MPTNQIYFFPAVSEGKGSTVTAFVLDKTRKSKNSRIQNDFIFIIHNEYAYAQVNLNLLSLKILFLPFLRLIGL